MARTEKLTPNAFNAVVGIVLNGSFNCTQVFGKRWIEKRLHGNRPQYRHHLRRRKLRLRFRRAFRLRQSGRARAHHFARRRVGQIPDSPQRHRARPISHRRRLVAPHAFHGNGRSRKKYNPMQRFGRHDELTNLAAFLISDMAPYINGECVVIDGGQWLRGAGEFNDLATLPDSAWEAMESARQKKP